jgi:hypothetical protein
MRAVDASRLGEFAGRLGAMETGEVDRAVRLLFGVLLCLNFTLRHNGRQA